MADLVGANTLPEAAVSWTVRYRSPAGFDAMLTLRGTDPVEVLTVGNDLMTRMSASGCTPTGYAGNGHANGTGAETKPCPIHSGALLRKHEKNGQSWWSHKVEATGEWCRGKPNGGGQ